MYMSQMVDSVQGCPPDSSVRAWRPVSVAHLSFHSPSTSLLPSWHGAGATHPTASRTQIPESEAHREPSCDSWDWVQPAPLPMARPVSA